MDKLVDIQQGRAGETGVQGARATKELISSRMTVARRGEQTGILRKSAHDLRRRHGIIPATKALFSSEKISDFDIVALSFLFDKYCPIMN